MALALIGVQVLPPIAFPASSAAGVLPPTPLDVSTISDYVHDMSVRAVITPGGAKQGGPATMPALDGDSGNGALQS